MNNKFMMHKYAKQAAFTLALLLLLSCHGSAAWAKEWLLEAPATTREVSADYEGTYQLKGWYCGDAAEQYREQTAETIRYFAQAESAISGSSQTAMVKNARSKAIKIFRQAAKGGVAFFIKKVSNDAVNRVRVMFVGSRVFFLIPGRVFVATC